MSCKVIQTERAPAAIGPYSQAIEVDQLLFVSGQIGLRPDTGELISDDFGEQTKQVLANMNEVLLAASCSKNDVVAVDVFLTDMGQFGAFNQIYEQFFAGHKPARAVVEVRALPRGAKVEIKCIAHRH
jgi:2-iminobutanoate/2-iminopropanoate deaminase